MNRYEIYKETDFEWIGEIHFDWELSREGKFFNQRLEKADDITYPPLSVTMSGIVDQLSNAAKTNDGDNRKLVKKDDFVINSRSDRKGSSGISPRDGSVSLINIVLEPHGLDPQFIQHLFKSYFFKEEYFRNGKGIHWDLWTTRWDQFKNINIPIPSTKEQKLISLYLDKKTEQIDRLIDKIQKKIELLKEQRISLINQCVTKGLDQNAEMKDSGIDWIGKIPKNWNTIPNKYIFLEYFGGSWGDDPKDDQKENLVRVIRVTEFNMKTLCISSDISTIRSLKLEKNSKKYIKKNDLILEKSGGGEKTPVGRVVLVDKDLPYPTINSNFTNICRPNTNIVYPRFVVYSFWSKYKNGQTLRNIKQTTGIQNLDLSGFMSEIFILPEIEEQIKISNYLDNKIYKINNMIKKLDSKISFLKEYRKSLISSAVTGVIRVSEDLI